MYKFVKLMLVAVYIISECDCDMIPLDEALCPDNRKTVIGATVEKVLGSDATGNKLYQIVMEVNFKNGPNALEAAPNSRITMKFPSQEMSCGHNFPVNMYKSYVVAGDVGLDGVLSSNMCQYVRPLEEALRTLTDQQLLYGITTPSCGRNRK